MNDRKATEPIEIFEGRDVGKTTIEVTNAGDGLSAALAIDPRVMSLHEKVVVVLRCEVAKIRHQDDTKAENGALVRVHVLKAGTATILDDDEPVREALDAQHLRIKEYEDELARQMSLDAELAAEAKEAAEGGSE